MRSSNGKAARSVRLAGASAMIMVLAILSVLSSASYADWFFPFRLTYDASSSETFARCIASDPFNNLHVVWKDDRDGNWEIYYKKYDGVIWGADVRLTNNESYSFCSSVATDGSGNVHVVWYDGRDGNNEIYYKKYDGVSWGADVRLTNNAYDSAFPSVATDGSSNVHVVWWDNRAGHYGIYCKKYDGVSWGADVRLSNCASLFCGPSVATDGAGNVHVVWMDDRDGNYEVYYKKYDGISWGADVRLTNNTYDSAYPSVATDGSGDVHAVWRDNRDGNYEVYYKKYDGVSWGADVRLTNNTYDSVYPSVSTDGSGNVHVVWQDNRDGNEEIYWREYHNGVLPKPTLTSIQPSSWFSNEIHTASLAGGGFVYPDSVWLEKSGESRIVAYDLMTESSTKIACAVSLDSAALGYWDVVLKNADGKMDTLPSGFCVMPGRPWGEDTRLTSAWSLTSGNNARCVACDTSGNVHVVWVGALGTYFAVQHKLYDGVSWHPDEPVSAPAMYGQDGATIATGDSGSLRAAWTEYGGAVDRLVHRRFDGVGWGPLEILSSGLCTSPSLAVADSGRAHLVWCDGGEIYQRVSDESGWGPYERLTNSGYNADKPSAASNHSGNVYMVWNDERGSAYFKAFDGVNWGADVRLTDSGGRPSVAVDRDGKVHVAWTDQRDGNSEIYYKCYDGAIWGEDQRLTNNAGDSYGPSIATDGSGNVHVVWTDTRDGNSEIYYKRYDGAIWGADQRLTNNTSASYSPSVAADAGGNVYVVWTDERDGGARVYYKRWVPSTAPAPTVYSFSPREAGNMFPLSAVVTGTGFLASPRVWLSQPGQTSVEAQNVVRLSATYLTCDLDLRGAAAGSWRVFVKNSDQQEAMLAGAIQVFDTPWCEEQRVSHDVYTSSTSASGGRAVARDAEGTVHTVWYDNREGDYEIYYSMWDGSSWGPELRLTYNTGSSQLPSVVLGHSGRLHVCWQDSRDGNWEIYYKRRDGMTWGPDVRLTSDAGGSINPSLSVDRSGYPFVAFQDSRYGNWEILCTRWDGIGWIEERLTNDPAVSRYPAIASDSTGSTYVFWEDTRDGNSEIYYRVWDGSAWSLATRLTTTSTLSTKPTCGCDDAGRVMVAWEEHDGSAASIRGKMHAGSGWVDLGSICSSGASPSICGDGKGRFHLVWQDDVAGKPSIFWKSYSGIWTLGARLTTGSGSSDQPSVAADGLGKIAVAWRDDRDGNPEIYARHWEGDAGTAGVADGQVSVPKFGLRQIAPNPVTSDAEIRFGLASAGDACLHIYDVTGRLVWEYDVRRKDQGLYSVRWDGKDRFGGVAAAGVYFVRIESGRQASSAKMVVLR